MKNFIKNLWTKHKLLLALLIALAAGIITLYRMVMYTYITVKLKDARPFHHHAPVFYKGHKVGKIAGVRHSKDYQYTLVKLVLYPHDLNLPENMEAKLKIIKRGRFEKDYVDLIYPEKPTAIRLKNHSVIDGTATIDAHSYFASLDTENLEEMEKNAAATLANLESSTSGLNELFAMVNSIVEENRENINLSAKNLAAASQNTNALTSRIDRTITQKKLEDVFNNVDAASANVNAITQSFTGVGESIGGTTGAISESMPMLECALANATAIASNLNEITTGIKCTMRKPFGGLRILFGKSIDN